MRKGSIKELKINQEISSPELRLIDENGKQLGVVSRDQAMYLAYEAELDLAEVNSNSNPPVAKIMDYGKYRYAQEKLESKQKSRSRGPETKEIRLSFKINQHDLDFKKKQAIKFLSDGDKVKISLRLIGREMAFKEKVRDILENFKNDINGEFVAPVEKLGNNFSATITSKKNETKNS